LYPAPALVASLPILFLDEPTTGLDPRSRLGLWEIIGTQTKNCNTVFLTMQYLEEADRLASQIVIMDRGKIIREGSPKDLKDCCGGETQVKLRLADRNQMEQACEVLKKIAGDKVIKNDNTGEIRLPAMGGTSVLTEVINLLQTAEIHMAELGLVQPT
jgi:ABC-2 type transport system ATP-binding protein